MKIITRCLELVTKHRAAGLVLLLFTALAVVYSLVTPPFEAGDESRHYAVVKYMADTGRLPVQEPGEAQVHWSHEGNQPPLYYALAAALTFWIDTGSWNDVYRYNPHTTIGDPLRPDNKNIILHPPGEGWPWRGHVLAVHLIRFFSIALAGVTVLAGYGVALHLFRGRRGLAAGAMAVTAFNPMFLFISASVNNDNLVIMLVSLALWLIVRAAAGADRRGGAAARQGMGTAALLGLLVGLGALSKLYALGLLPLAGLLLFWLAYRRETGDRSPGPDRAIPPPARFPGSAFRRVGRGLAWNLAMLAVVLAVAGPFYGRNAALYHGDFLALQVMRDTAGQRAQAPTLATLSAEFEGFRIAYWALFGGVNILAAPWIYRVLDLVSLVAALGVAGFAISLVLHARRGAPTGLPIARSTFLILAGWYGIMLAGFIAWNLTQPAGQGRLLYPAIIAISALGVLGLTWWLPPPAQKGVSLLVGAGLFVLAAAAPPLYIAPAYARPARLVEADLPADLQRVDLVYDGTMRLIGYRLPVTTVRPAETVPLTLYWQLLKPAPLDYSIFVHLLGRQRQVAGQVDTYPGGGLWPATLLQPGDILADQYTVPVRPETEQTQAPTRLLVAAGIYDYNEPGRPGRLAVNAAGQPVEPIIASLRLVPWQWPAPARLETPVEFAGPGGQIRITLLSYQLVLDDSKLTLNWQAGSAVPADYTVFIQLWRENSGPNPPAGQEGGEYVTGFDGLPRQGDYPTSLWQPGDVVVDTHVLELAGQPAGEYSLQVGLYNPATGQRLAASLAGQPLPDGALNLGRFSLGEQQP